MSTFKDQKASHKDSVRVSIHEFWGNTVQLITVIIYHNKTKQRDKVKVPRKIVSISLYKLKTMFEVVISDSVMGYGEKMTFEFSYKMVWYHCCVYAIIYNFSKELRLALIFCIAT